MAWKPSTLTRQQLEERRLEGGRWLNAGRLGVSRMAVSHWGRRLARAGRRGLRQRRITGRPPKLTRLQQRELKRRLKRGARAAGFPTERWTMRRVQQLIERQFEVRYHPNYLNR